MVRSPPARMVNDAGIEDAGIEDAGCEDAGFEDAGCEDAGTEGPAARAARLGVLVTWQDDQGRDAQLSPETLEALLAALGEPAAGEAEPGLGGVQVGWLGGDPRSPVRLHRGGTVDGWGSVPGGVDQDLPVDQDPSVDQGTRDDPGRPGGAEEAATLRDLLDERSVSVGVATRRDGPDGGWWELPVGLAPGYYRLVGQGGPAELVVLAPERLPPAVPGGGRCFGFAVQLYAVRSQHSWGMGDFADLADLARWAGGLGAGFLLLNPLHAPAPTPPVADSPYRPSSRRFVSWLHLRCEDLPEYASASDHVRERVDALGRDVPRHGPIDRDAVWRAKRGALELLCPWDRLGDPESLPVALRDFATWCALAEALGPDWRRWPAGLRHPRAGEVASRRHELASRVAFFAWVQGACDEQLRRAQVAAMDSGMALGILHDLAVGVDPAGADAWLDQDALAGSASLGAPPDAFTPAGQDWQMPPWHPRRLVSGELRPFRDVLAAVCARGRGVRVDHALGLFRSWWIPHGLTGGAGGYVAAPGEALLASLVLEAHRAGALVVGEDLGVVGPGVRESLSRRGVLGCSVLLFEPDRPGSWRADSIASVTTHDLPTARTILRAAQAEERIRRGLVHAADVPGERLRARERRDEIVGTLGELGLATPEADEEELLEALHAALALSPARLVVINVSDAVGDLRQPNLPGTIDAYPNWCLPLADVTGSEVTLEDLCAHPLPQRVARRVRQALDDGTELAVGRAGPGAAEPGHPAGGRA